MDDTAKKTILTRFGKLLLECARHVQRGGRAKIALSTLSSNWNIVCHQGEASTKNGTDKDWEYSTERGGQN